MTGKQPTNSAKELEMETCLHRRGNIFYVRARIPLDLHKFFGQTQEIKRSLKTSDRAEARRRLRHELSRIQKQFDDLRKGPIDVNNLEPKALHNIPVLELQEIANLISLHHLEADNSSREHLASNAALAEYRRERIEYRDVLKDVLAKKEWETHFPAVESVLKLLGITFDPNEPNFQILNRLMLEASIVSADAILERLNGRDVKTSDVVAVCDVYRPATTGKIKTLSDIAALVIKEQPELASKTVAEKTTIARDFDRYFTNKSIRSARKEDCQAFVDFLRDVEKLKPSTIEKKVGFLKGLFDYATEHELIPKNPAVLTPTLI